MTGIVQPSPAVSSDQDTDIEIIYILNGGSSVMLDAGSPSASGTVNPVTFPCNAGDTYSITQVDINAVGPSAASTALTGTVPTITTPPTTVPTTPGTPTVTFTNP